jgi:hypothetical protein
MRLKKGSQVTYIKKYANEAQEGFSGHIYKENRLLSR